MLENITWGLVWDLKCTLRFLFSLEWDLLLQVSEELEEFPEPPVDHTDQDKPDRTSTGGTQSSNISHQLQTQTQTSTASKASKVSTASVIQQPRYRRPARQPAMQPM